MDRTTRRGRGGQDGGAQVAGRRWAAVRRRVSLTVADARDWALALLVAMVLVKAAWVVFTVFDGALQIGAAEWALMPPMATAHHVLVAAGAFVAYALVLLAGAWSRPSRVVTTVVVAFVQGTLIYWHMVAFRIAVYIGTYPTFGIIRESFAGGVALPSLLAPENLAYNAVAFLLMAAAIVVPIRARRRGPRWPRPRVLAGVAAGVAIWTAGGVVAARATRSDLAHTDVDSGLFFLTEMLEEHVERFAPVNELPPASYPRAPIFGETAPFLDARHVRDRDTWRRGRRNVVLIVLESTPARQASFAGPVVVDGETREMTPVLSSLRPNMLLFRNHYSVQPESINCLYSLACSLYPYPLRPSITDINPRIPCTSLSELLSRQGYRAGLFHSGHFSFYRKDLFYDDRGFAVMRDGHSMPGRTGAYRYRWGVDERVTVAAVNDFISDNRHRPFFVEYIPVFPHVPYQVPEPALEVFGTANARDSYSNSVRYVDAAVGEIVDHLRELDLLDETLLVVVGDHGEAFGEHPGNRIHSLFIYDENVHVPLALYNPVLFSGSPASDRVSSHIDVLPTIADLLDLPPDPGWQGSSLVADSPERPVFFYAIHGREMVGMRDGRWKSIWNRENDVFELYDLDDDPLELRNLAAQMADHVARYREALSAWRSYHIDLIPRFGRIIDEAERVGRPLTRRPLLASFQPHNYDSIANRSVSGSRLNVDGVEYDRGLGAHAESWYLYDLGGGRATRLVGRVGRHQRTGSGTILASVFLDGRLAFDSGPISSGTPAMGLDLDLGGARQVALASWTGRDGPRSDHVDWIDLALVGPSDAAVRPGRTVALDAVRPSGANTAGIAVGRIRALPRGFLRLGGETLRSGLLLAPTTTLAFDVRALGATRVEGRLAGASLGGSPPPWVELLFDTRRALRLSTNGGDDQAFDLAVPAGARLLTVRSTPGSAGGRAVLADARVETSEAALVRARRSMARVSAPRDFALASLPPAPDLPAPGTAGWGAAPPGLAVPARVNRRRVLWLGAGARVGWVLGGLHARRLEVSVRALGEASCRPVAAVEGASLPWSSPPLEPGGEPATAELDVTGADRVSLAVEGEAGCFVLVEGAVLASPAASPDR